MPGEQDELGLADEESLENAASDNGASQVPGLVPSSLGLSFCVSTEASELQVTANWGGYMKERSATLLTSTGNPKMVWRSKARSGQVVSIALREGSLRALATRVRGAARCVCQGGRATACDSASCQ